jgi:uncharacterized protein (DUF1015 family)
VPTIRPFRALRYDRSTIGDLALVVAPPYDVIGPAEADRLEARHPANVVRLDLPREQAGDEPDDRYRRAARTLAAWRSDGTLHKDPHPSIYVYEQTYRLPGTEVERTQRGFFARLLLEPLGPESGVLPHERTLAAPREDRYKLLRATGVNTSPIVALYVEEDEGAKAAAVLAAVTEHGPDVEVVDDDEVCHRMWAVAADGDGAEHVAPLLRAGVGPLTIADGHHRYETALRYRDERRMSRSCEEDPAFDYVLALLLDADQALTVLPTHRIVRGLGDEGVTALIGGFDELFDVEWGVSEADLRTRFGAVATAEGGAGRFGLWTRSGGAFLRAKRWAFDRETSDLGAAVGALDVTVLGIALERLAGIDADALAAGRVAFTKSVDEAISAVDAGLDGADAAFLLEPTPVSSVLAVAADGDVMPQKSTYFYPKALTGLVINPHEW